MLSEEEIAKLRELLKPAFDWVDEKLKSDHVVFLVNGLGIITNKDFRKI